jgi:hypothetical protein
MAAFGAAVPAGGRERLAGEAPEVAGRELPEGLLGGDGAGLDVRLGRAAQEGAERVVRP